ncbi:MAG: H-NS histone family protein [Shimia sp.]|uniref:H-NS histone family protein n=1 Tax=Shimia sp. TaxID=1954381 RepID=UPI001B120B93|nr:H-NS histone family protein [Shimia sp.]MBO6899520.1 H-NS histone family protein [Shimia sp.]
MTDFGYDALSLQELEQIQKDVTKAIASFQVRHRKEAKAKLDAVAKEFGFSSADELVGHKPAKAKKTMIPYYRNPENHEEICGKPGRKPAWFQSCLDKGYTIEQLMIENQ